MKMDESIAWILIFMLITLLMFQIDYICKKFKKKKKTFINKK